MDTSEERRVEGLVLIFSAVARRIALELQEMLFDEEKLHRYREILRLLRQLQLTVRGWAKTNIAEFFVEQDALAIASLDADSVGRTGRTFSPLTKESIEASTKSIVIQTDKAIDSIKSLAQKVLQKKTGLDSALSPEVLRAVEKSLAAGERKLPLKIQKILSNRFRDGVVSILGRDGRRYHYSLNYYVSLVAHQIMRQTASAAVIQRAEEQEQDLVMVSPNPSTLPYCYCNIYAGKVFSISGTSDRYPPLGLTPNSGPPFHPWCRHTISIFIEDEHSESELSEFANVPDQYLLRPGETDHGRLLAEFRKEMRK